jgi:cellulose synthase/poly-beta-1,6-N-acetylglucosamine synthase-like glycosyltransferase
MLSKKREVSIKKKREMAVRDAENIIYDMVLKADKKGKLVSYKEIEEKLTEPEYQLSKGSISGVLKNMRLKHMIKLRIINNRHYYELPWLTTPYWLAFIFLTIIIITSTFFLLLYKWHETIKIYYSGNDNAIYVNHHFVTIFFVVIIVINNIIFAFCWDKFGTRKLKHKIKKNKEK